MKTKPNKVQILNENGDKQIQNTHVEVNIFASKSQRHKVGFGLFRIIFTLPKLSQKELALNSTEILQLKLNCTRHCTSHFIAHGRAYIKILFMMAQ